MRKREIKASIKRSLKGIEKELKRIERASSSIVDSLLCVEFPGNTVGAMVKRAVEHCRADLVSNLMAPSAAFYQFRKMGNTFAVHRDAD